MSSTIFRIFNPKSAKQDPVEKRRAQLRRAQQTYRDRKDKYTKSLEHELVRIRASEASLVYDAQCLRQTVDALLGILSQHGIEPPASVWRDGTQSQIQVIESPFTEEKLIGVDQQGKPLTSGGRRISPSRGAVQEPAANSEFPHQPSLNERSRLPVSRSAENETPRQPTLQLRKSLRRISDADAATIGMEFVLTVETPCLDHIHANPQKPHEPHGHALTTTAQLSYASSALLPESPKPDNTALQYMPAGMLSRLLELSPVLCSEYEVTPVQAWNHLRSQPYFNSLEIRLVKMLADKLREAAICHGFGAVVEQNRFRELALEVLGLRQLL